MPNKHCCFGTCNSDSRYPKEDVFFLPFVKPHVDKKKSERWIHACRRQNFNTSNVTKHTYICSKHFVGGKGPTLENPDPIPATAIHIPKPRRKRELQSQVTEIPGKWQKRNVEHQTEDNPVDEANGTLEQEIIMPTNEIIENERTTCDESCQTSSLGVDVESQTDNFIEAPYNEKFDRELKILRDKLSSVVFNVETCKGDDKKFKFYTGLNFEQFSVLFKFLDVSAYTLRIWQGTQRQNDGKRYFSKNILSVENQLFLTLVRLRCGLLIEDLGYRFQISSSYVSKIVLTWVQFMYYKFKQFDIFPSAEDTKSKGLPKAFQKFRGIRVIIDCFEVGIQKPKDYREQGNTYSSYKAQNTVKILVGVVPTGGICFISDAYEGCMSDREVVKKSEFSDKLDRNDLILADRGFNIQDLCNEHNCSIVIPPFLKGRDKLTKAEVLLTRNIAAARIHVERSIGRIKQYRLLQKTLPKTLLPIISQLTFVIAMLVNFQEPLVR